LKELRRQQLAPEGAGSQSGPAAAAGRSNSVMTCGPGRSSRFLLFTGCRVSDVINLELTDLMMNERSGHGDVPVRQGRQNRRSVPLPLTGP